MEVIATEKLPIKTWVTDCEDGALAQARNLANLPFAFRHVALMPDCHQGYGMPIGGVLATQGVVIPNAVGVDIGCGMCAIETDLHDVPTETLKAIMGKIRKVIPVGFNHHKAPQENDFVLPGAYGPVIAQEEKKIDYQIGTLGGGNHFIEIQENIVGRVWIMIHSGSRNLGFKVAKYYNDLAVFHNEKWHSAVPKKWELAFLPADSEEGRAYIIDMSICVSFAFANRFMMMSRIMEIFSEMCPGCNFGQMINIAHNYAALENHFGKNVWVHRKGATMARENTMGIIPGSQGTKSYIVMGKGNRESFQSCSHGAGRKLARKAACRTLDLAAEQEKLNSQGIIHGIRSEKDLDEAPGAYKDIGVVMQNQADLVEIVTELTPIAVIKG